MNCFIPLMNCVVPPQDLLNVQYCTYHETFDALYSTSCELFDASYSTSCDELFDVLNSTSREPFDALYSTSHELFDALYSTSRELFDALYSTSRELFDALYITSRELCMPYIYRELFYVSYISWTVLCLIQNLSGSRYRYVWHHFGSVLISVGNVFFSFSHSCTVFLGIPVWPLPMFVSLQANKTVKIWTVRYIDFDL